MKKRKGVFLLAAIVTVVFSMNTRVLAAAQENADPPVALLDEPTEYSESLEQASYETAAYVSAGTKARSGRESISKMTMDEVRELYDSIPYIHTFYAKEPVIAGADYAPAVLSEEALANVSAWINYYRSVAGLGTVTLSDEGNLAASYGALCMAMTNTFSHYPPKPDDMSDGDYTAALDATSSSNISYSSGYGEPWVLEVAVSGQIRDSGSNMDRLGHRRWLLNPSMATTGVGTANNGDEYYTAIKAFNSGVSSISTATDYDYISWPASGNNLTETFSANTPWSITLNPQRFKKPSASDVKIVLTRMNDGKSWTFDSTTGNEISVSGIYFNINNDGYGVSNCIIFRPDVSDIPAHVGSYRVEVTGLKDISGNAAALSYEVNFAPAEADLADYTVETASTCRYTGAALCPEVRVEAFSTKLIEDVDYTLEYKNNTNPGMASVIVRGIGSYTGTVELSFEIIDYDILTFDANGGTGAPAYAKIENGKAVIPEEIPAKDRKHFAGWAKDKNAETAQYQPGDTLFSDASIVLYAVWSEPLTLNDGEIMNVRINAAGTGEWFRFIPADSCKYQIAFTGRANLNIYYTEGNTSYSRTIRSGGSYGVSTPMDLTAGQLYEFFIRFANASETGTLTLSVTVQHTPTVTKEAVDATCTEDGNTAELTCSQCGKLLQASHVIPAVGHDWGEPTYVWAEDNSSVTASRVCGRDSGHVETETVQTAYTVKIQATETEKGTAVYTSEAFENPAFSVQTKEITLQPTGYAVSYEWRDDGQGGFSVTGTAVPYAEGAETITETVKAAYKVTKEPECERAGEGIYTASFAGARFKTQTRTAEIPATGHEWGNISYQWSENNRLVTASAHCLHNDSHVLRETVSASAAVTKEAGCETKGATTYTAVFGNALFTEQAETVEDIAPLGHLHESIVTEPTCTERGFTTHTCTRCGSSYIDSYTEPAGHTWGDEYIVEREATCAEEGCESIHCTICGAVKGDSIRLTEKLPHQWDSGKITKMPTASEEGVRTFTCSVCGEEKYESICECTFTDVTDPSIWYYESVYWAVRNGVTSGYGQGTFQPMATLTRAQTVTFLYNLAGKPDVRMIEAEDFSDVPSDMWYYNAVKWAVANGVTNGYGKGTFRPNALCTRAMIVTFLANYSKNIAGTYKEPTSESNFTDVAADAWYKGSVDWAVENGITSGYGQGTFSPNVICNRAMMVTFLKKVAALPQIS